MRHRSNTDAIYRGNNTHLVVSIFFFFSIYVNCVQNPAINTFRRGHRNPFAFNGFNFMLIDRFSRVIYLNSLGEIPGGKACNADYYYNFY